VQNTLKSSRNNSRFSKRLHFEQLEERIFCDAAPVDPVSEPAPMPPPEDLSAQVLTDQATTPTDPSLFSSQTTTPDTLSDASVQQVSRNEVLFIPKDA